MFALAHHCRRQLTRESSAWDKCVSICHQIVRIYRHLRRRRWRRQRSSTRHNRIPPHQWLIRHRWFVVFIADRELTFIFRLFESRRLIALTARHFLWRSQAESVRESGSASACSIMQWIDTPHVKSFRPYNWQFECERTDQTSQFVYAHNYSPSPLHIR